MEIFIGQYKLDPNFEKERNYHLLADAIENNGIESISLFYTQMNLMLNNVGNIVIKTNDFMKFLNNFKEATSFKNFAVKNKILLVSVKDKDSYSLLKNFKNFIFRINNKNEIVECELKEKNN